MTLGKYAKENGIAECIICGKTFFSFSKKRILCDDKDCRNSYRRCVSYITKRMAKTEKLINV